MKAWVPQSRQQGEIYFFSMLLSFKFLVKPPSLKVYLGSSIHYVAKLTDETLNVHGLCVVQEVWAEEWECLSAIPFQGQGTGGCRGPAAALWPDQDTLAWVALVQWEDP